MYSVIWVFSLFHLLFILSFCFVLLILSCITLLLKNVIHKKYNTKFSKNDLHRKEIYFNSVNLKCQCQTVLCQSMTFSISNLNSKKKTFLGKKLWPFYWWLVNKANNPIPIIFWRILPDKRKKSFSETYRNVFFVYFELNMVTMTIFWCYILQLNKIGLNTHKQE